MRFHPAIRRGLLERLASEPPEVTRTLLSGPVGTQLGREDLDGHPGLTELWLLESVASGRERPMRAFDEIVDIRGAAGRSPRIDATLLQPAVAARLPAGRPRGTARHPDRPVRPDVLDWFAAELSDRPRPRDGQR